MKISKRLLAIAKYLNKNKIFYDCGSDHGLLPCFCVLNNYCQKAYAGDNKKGPLEKAKENIDYYNLKGKVIPILADGLECVEDDVEVIVISGVGFLTAKNILEKVGIKKFAYLIVQINKNSNLFRKYLAKKGYKIIDEDIVFDNFYYEIIVFNPNEYYEMNALEIEYGPINLKKRKKEFIDYLKFKQKEYNNIFQKNKDDKLIIKIDEIEKIIKNEEVF